MAICLLKKQWAQIQQDFKDKGIVFRALDYKNLDGTEITAKLKPIVGDNAEALSQVIQEKSILKGRERAEAVMSDKVNLKGNYSPARAQSIADEKAEMKQRNMQRILSPKEWQTYQSSLAAKIVGNELIREQSAEVFKQSKNIEDMKAANKDNPKLMQGTTVEIERAKQKLSQYIGSLSKDSVLKTIGNDAAETYRDAFIGVKTGVKTATLGSANVVLDAMTRRLATFDTIGKGVDIGLKTQFVKDNMELGIKTGENSALNDGKNTFGGGGLDYSKSKDINISEREGVTKVTGAIAKGAKLIAIDVLHKYPMLANASLNMADALDKWSASASKTSGGDVNEIFKDAAKINPETEIGQIVRNRAQKEVFRALNINDTWLSKGAMTLKGWLNTGGFHFGDYLLPMAKIPSSVIANQLENFGGGIGSGIIEFGNGVKDLMDLKKSGEESTAKGVEAVFKIRNGAQTLIRTLGIMSAAYLIAGNFKKKDRDFKSDQYGNYYVHANGYWISTQAFGPASIAIDGMLDAKSGHGGALWDYTKAGLTGGMQAPVASDITSTVQSVQKQKSVETGVATALQNFYNPIIKKDIEKSAKEKSFNPLFFGSMIRTDAQMKQESNTAQKESVKSKIQNTKDKNKKQTFF